MKILMVAIPNHHFFRWVNQLEQASFDVYWFDVSSSGTNSPQIPWVNQNTNWKLKWDFPLRASVKQKLPKIYKAIQKINEVNINSAFNNYLNKIQPEIVHCFEMKLSGIPILEILLKHKKTPVIYSSWGSDLFYFKELGTPIKTVNAFLRRCNYLITDCKRDIKIAKVNGFNKTVLGVYPGNGGLDVTNEELIDLDKRKTIIFKGYQFDVGEAIQILKAIELLSKAIKVSFQFIVYSADQEVIDFIANSKILQVLNFKILPRKIKIPNEDLIALMGESTIHIGNNLSDGMPNTMLEAMMQGCFPIQSNPGNATAEVIKDGFNGFLIPNPYDFRYIAQLIETALLDKTMLNNAAVYNRNLIKEHYNRSLLKFEIVNLYQQIQPN